MANDEKAVLLALCDISGYTRFMVAHREALAHGQVIITELMQALLREANLPLVVAKLEGDAVFLYAVLSGAPKQTVVARLTALRLKRRPRFQHLTDDGPASMQAETAGKESP